MLQATILIIDEEVDLAAFDNLAIALRHFN